MKPSFGLFGWALSVCLALTLISSSHVLRGEAPTVQAEVRRALADFNGDGFEDLAVGAPFDSIGAVPNVGTVTVLYGSTDGLGAAGSQLWHQNSPGIEDRAEYQDHFGSSIAAGDFNGDGFADLAVGVPQEDIGDIELAGAVNVLYGSPTGLTVQGNQFWHQDSPGILDKAEGVDWFARHLATGDFNGDGYADLAVGVSDEDLDVASAGAVNVLYGSAIGLSAEGNQFWTQTGLGDVPEPFDFFGSAVAAGDFDADGYADLAIGVPEEDVPPVTGPGAVNVIYGSPLGLSRSRSQFWTQQGLPDGPDPFDSFGDVLTAGDFNGDGFADLGIGVPEEWVADVVLAGAVNVLYGSRRGLSSDNAQFWHQDSPGIRGRAKSGEFFGSVAASGDFNGDGFWDLAITVINEAVSGLEGSGVVHVLYGTAGGLTAKGDQIWTQANRGLPDEPEVADRFGVGVAAGDFDRNGRAELAIGAYEEINGAAAAGAINVLRGSTGGLSGIGSQFWHQNKAGIRGQAGQHDHFGEVLGTRAGTRLPTLVG